MTVGDGDKPSNYPPLGDPVAESIDFRRGFAAGYQARCREETASYLAVIAAGHQVYDRVIRDLVNLKPFSEREADRLKVIKEGHDAGIHEGGRRGCPWCDERRKPITTPEQDVAHAGHWNGGRTVPGCPWCAAGYGPPDRHHSGDYGAPECECPGKVFHGGSCPVVAQRMGAQNPDHGVPLRAPEVVDLNAVCECGHRIGLSHFDDIGCRALVDDKGTVCECVRTLSMLLRTDKTPKSHYGVAPIDAGSADDADHSMNGRPCRTCAGSCMIDCCPAAGTHLHIDAPSSCCVICGAPGVDVGAPAVSTDMDGVPFRVSCGDGHGPDDVCESCAPTGGGFRTKLDDRGYSAPLTDGE